METFLIRALQLILCFSILILLHEGGHFLAARLFKIRVDRFYLFFNPKFHLLSTYDTWLRRLLRLKPEKVPVEESTDENGKVVKRKKYVGTEYGLGWLPLGGYVSIAGMIDENMDKEALKQPAQPWEFRSKPAWQRLIVMVAGVVVNFLTALVIYAMVLFAWGDTYVPIENMTHGFKFNERAQQLGFRDGDIPLRTERETFSRFSDSQSIGDVYRAISEAREVVVLRDGKEVKLTMPGDINMLQMMKEQPPFMLALAPSVVDSVEAGTPAALAGIRQGDRIVAFNGTPIHTWNEYTDQISRLSDILTANVEEVPTEGSLFSIFQKKTLKGNAADSLRVRTIHLAVMRTEGTVDTLQAVLTPELVLGVRWNHPLATYQTVTHEYGFLESFPAGIRHGWNVLCGYVDDLKYLFTKDGAKSVGSFGAIGSLFPATWDWPRFWEMTAFISLMLAFMNILPIPALDGGHAFFLVCEVITRRKPSDQFMEWAERIGITLLMLLMGYAIFNDFLRFVF